MYFLLICSFGLLLAESPKPWKLQLGKMQRATWNVALLLLCALVDYMIMLIVYYIM
jgi:hypothetical protein